MSNKCLGYPTNKRTTRNSRETGRTDGDPTWQFILSLYRVVRKKKLGLVYKKTDKTKTSELERDEDPTCPVIPCYLSLISSYSMCRVKKKLLTAKKII